MTRSRKPGTVRGSKAWRERVSAGVRRAGERRREAARVRPRDLERLKTGQVAAGLRPLLDLAELEARELHEALGGEQGLVTPQRRLVIEDLVAVGVTLRAVLGLFLETRDPELASRVATLASARRASLALLGLERWSRTVDPLRPVDVEWSEGDAAEPEVQP